MPPEISIVIVLYNSADMLAGCLRSLHSSVASGWAQLIAADNASPDDSVKMVRAGIPQADVVTLAENRGFAAGVNAAADQALVRCWLFLNPDVRVTGVGLESLVEGMDR